MIVFCDSRIMLGLSPKDDVLVVITRDESACRARELHAQLLSRFTMHYAYVLLQSFMFSRMRALWFAIVADIEIFPLIFRWSIHSRVVEKMLRKCCPRQFFTSPNLIKNIYLSNL